MQEAPDSSHTKQEFSVDIETLRRSSKASNDIKLQKSRSRIRNHLRKRIKVTFSKEGLDLDPDRKA